MIPIRYSSLFLLLIGSYMANSQEWKQYADSAKFFQEQKNNSAALEYYLKANHELKKDSASTTNYQMNSNDIGDLYVAIGQYGKAEPFYVESKQLIEKLDGKSNAAYATICNNLGRLYRLMGQYEKSESLLLEAKELREKLFGKENADYATTCNNLAILYFDVGQYETAKPFYLEAKQIREKVLGKEHVDYAMSCNNLGVFYMVTGKPEEAEPLYIEAKQIREKVLGKEHQFYAASCNNLGALYLEMGQYRKVEPLYLEAKQIREKTLGKQHPEYAASCNNLAILYMDIGSYEKSELLYMEALQISEKVLGTKHPEYAKSCNNLALLYRTLGQYEKSEKLFTEARQVLGEVLGKEHFEYAKSCNNLGALYMAMGDYGKAAPLFDEARQIWKKVVGNEHPEYAKSCNNLALIYRNSGEYKKAELLFLETNQIREKVFGKEHPDYAEGCDNLGVVYSDMEKYNDALSFHLLAKQIRESALGKEHIKYIETCLNLANVYRKMGDTDNAAKYYTEALTSQQAQTQKVFKFTTEPEKQSYVRKINEFRNLYLSYCLLEADHSAIAYNVSLATRNLILSTSQQLRQSIYYTNDTALINKYNTWVTTREQLAYWYSRPLIEKKARIKLLEQKANTLEKELTKSSEQFKKGQQQVTWQKIQQSLNVNEAAIEFAEFQFDNGKRLTDSIYYIALVLRKDRPAPQLVQLFEKREIDALLQKTGTWSAIDSLYSSQVLYEKVWRPLQPYLANISKVYYASAGLLHKINLSAITSDSKYILGEKYRLVHLNTTASVLDHARVFITSSDKLSVYGGINFNADSAQLKAAAKPYRLNNESSYASRNLNINAERLPDLPYTEEEVDYITKFAQQKKYSIKALKGVEANEESVKALNGRNSPGVLHLATHGKFFPDPVKISSGKSLSGGKIFAQLNDPLFRSMLLLAGANNVWTGKSISGIQDGVLTAYEISNLYLPNTKLVILSACETALGDIQGSEGVYGLQRSFKIAGVKNLVMSLWAVPDNTTAEFMEYFYTYFFEKKSVDEAFDSAQKIMRNKYRSNPSKWAGLVLIH